MINLANNYRLLACWYSWQAVVFYSWGFKQNIIVNTNLGESKWSQAYQAAFGFYRAFKWYIKSSLDYPYISILWDKENKYIEKQTQTQTHKNTH